ncbi:hypothetical protein [Bacillus sp. FJAT-27264]|uniref:hypothetical protein n=1 Tax=Paenibacillus sp. (strain DSM 101736 / FJAT-27264) TaxID=1850362 RepID=UPI00257089DD|nr:hypothetical protein [Bacillus sp. FJAT-27264]
MDLVLAITVPGVEDPGTMAEQPFHARTVLMVNSPVMNDGGRGDDGSPISLGFFYIGGAEARICIDFIQTQEAWDQAVHSGCLLIVGKGFLSRSQPGNAPVHRGIKQYSYELLPHVRSSCYLQSLTAMCFSP